MYEFWRAEAWPKQQCMGRWCGYVLERRDDETIPSREERGRKRSAMTGGRLFVRDG